MLSHDADAPAEPAARPLPAIGDYVLLVQSGQCNILRVTAHDRAFFLARGPDDLNCTAVWIGHEGRQWMRLPSAVMDDLTALFAANALLR